MRVYYFLIFRAISIVVIQLKNNKNCYTTIDQINDKIER